MFQNNSIDKTTRGQFQPYCYIVMQAFEQAAKNVDDVPFGNVMDAATRDGLGLTPNSIMLYKKFDEPETKFTSSTDLLDAKDLESFVKMHSLPKVIQFSEKTAAQIFGESSVRVSRCCTLHGTVVAVVTERRRWQKVASKLTWWSFTTRQVILLSKQRS